MAPHTRGEQHLGERPVRHPPTGRRDSARACTARETDGLWKAVVDARTDLILGVSLLRSEAGEVLTTVQTAMTARLPHTALRDRIIIRP
ncbi:hypothetical protein [Streptomyces bungoensis]|uniref:hypothetical protein n=1 Tax=Streptomyces bungoensis TaxID=285568 RepID=UPI003CC68CB3